MLTIKMFYNDVLCKVRYELEWEKHSDARRSRLYTIREMLLAHAPLDSRQHDALVDVDEELYKFLDF